MTERPRVPGLSDGMGNRVLYHIDAKKNNEKKKEIKKDLIEEKNEQNLNFFPVHVLIEQRKKIFFMNK